MENSVKHLSMTQLFCENFIAHENIKKPYETLMFPGGMIFLQNSSNIDV